jgi:anti-sigma-K factor RskA
MHNHERLDDHRTFKELCALAQGNMLNSAEQQELERHLQHCHSCRKIYAEYSLISTTGMPLLAAHYGQDQESERWDDRNARHRLFSGIRDTAQHGPQLVKAKLARFPWLDPAKSRTAAAGIAACIMAALAVGAYHLGGLERESGKPSLAVASVPVQDSRSRGKAAEELLDTQAAEISRLQKQLSREEMELTKLRAAARAADDYSNALLASNSKNQEQLHVVSEQRETLALQLRDAEQAYQNAQLELTTIRAEHDRVLVRATSLASKVDELTAAAHEQERQLSDDEQYLASDRDIRELMGARKLYIADVFDVDSGSRTRKPFGRVFYTQNKSLIFYAFDLDHEPGVKSASTFQVWGQRDNESEQKSHPMNLGILYLDSESNRRWVLRFDDPKQLAEIDAVFVTVEPRGGSQKPTGKPLLYALLRKEANHP